MIARASRSLQLLISGRKEFFVLYGATVFLLGLFLVWLDFDAKVDVQISKASNQVQSELDEFYQKFDNLAQSRNFLTNVVFNVNLAASAEIDQLVDQFSYRANVFVYDSDRRYFGKNQVNNLNRFEYKLSATDLIIDNTNTWTFFERDKKRFIERYSVLRTDGSKVGYVRVVFSLDELQQKLLKPMQTGAHLTVKSSKFKFVRCSLNRVTDLYFCMPLDAKNLIKHSGTMLAFVLLLWAFLVFVVRFYLRGRLAGARAETLVEISSQVSHDIQSPLLALKVATKGLSELPDDKRLMVQRSIERIEDIVNDLKNKRESNLQQGNRQDLHLLYGLVSSILSEKRLQFKYRDIELDLFVDDGLQISFVSLVAQDFKRVLSNIINNAVEAIPGHGNVGIELEQSGSELVVRVRDNGIGIRSSLIEDSLEKGFSFGKRGGQGLGLYHANKTVKTWGARLNIVSKEGSGTNVEIRIPKAKEPLWFARKREITDDTKIVILDDDQNIHELWTTNLRSRGIQNELIHFYHVDSAEKSLASMDINNLVFLVDYELIHSDSSGIDFMLKNGIAHQSILVTARFDEEKVLQQCKNKSIELLPKILMNDFDLFYKKTSHQTKVDETGKVEHSAIDQQTKRTIRPPLEIHKSENDVKILIDDDPLVRSVWKMSAAKQGVNLLSFSSTTDFLDAAGSIPTRADIYIDLNLGDVQGDLWSKDLHKMGYKNLFITTGFDNIDLAKTPWIKAMISKEPPF